MGTNKYVIRGGEEGRERLRLLSEVMGPSTRALLEDVRVADGAACLDVGCGGGDVTFELAQRVGPAGRVIGIDVDEIELEIARRESKQKGLVNISFEARDVCQWEPAERFDVVYSRFLLTHLTNPGHVIEAMHRHARPGGVIALEDIDFRGHFAEPTCPALWKYVEFYTRTVQARGGDPCIGPKLPGLLRKAGFQDIRMKLFHPAALEGGIKLLTCITLEYIAEAVLADGLTSEGELVETIEELRRFSDNPHTILGGPRVFQVWARNGPLTE